MIYPLNLACESPVSQSVSQSVSQVPWNHNCSIFIKIWSGSKMFCDIGGLVCFRLSLGYCWWGYCWGINLNPVEYFHALLLPRIPLWTSRLQCVLLKELLKSLAYVTTALVAQTFAACSQQQQHSLVSQSLSGGSANNEDLTLQHWRLMLISSLTVSNPGLL